MGFFSWVKRAAKSVGAAIVKVAKAVVRTVRTIGKAVVAAAKWTARKVGKAMEDVGRIMQQKPTSGLERLIRLLEALLQRTVQQKSSDEVINFHAWLRLQVLEELLPVLIEQVSEARSTFSIDSNIRLLAETGTALLDDPASLTEEQLLAVENLCEQYLHATTEVLAMRKLVMLFEGNREEVEERLRTLEGESLRVRQLIREQELWAKLGRETPGLVEELRGRFSMLDAEGARTTQRLEDLELVSWTGEALLQVAEDRGVRDLYASQIDTIERIVFDFFRAGEEAILEPEARADLREAARIFMADAIRRTERMEKDAMEQEEVQVKT